MNSETRGLLFGLLAVVGVGLMVVLTYAVIGPTQPAPAPVGSTHTLTTQQLSRPPDGADADRARAVECVADDRAGQRGAGPLAAGMTGARLAEDACCVAEALG